MKNAKLSAGTQFPNIELTDATAKTVTLTKASNNKWSLIIIYRGFHCPICLKYLNALAEYTDKLEELNIDLVAVSADSIAQLDKMKEKGLKVNFPILTGLTVDQMKQLGLYISDPMSDSETDHVFAEPGLFLVNPKGTTVMIEIANAPFIRPDLEQLVSGIEFALGKDYPIRGTHN
jgi:peroxiredoxin